MQADAYSGYNGLYVDGRQPGMIIEAACWAHGRRKFFELAKLQKAPVAKAIDYSLKRWRAFTRFLDDGRLCMSNNAAERAVRGIAVGRRNWTFCGSDAGGHRAAAIFTLIETCKLNDVDARVWLADVLARIADYPSKQGRRPAAVELESRQGPRSSSLSAHHCGLRRMLTLLVMCDAEQGESRKVPETAKALLRAIN